METAQVLTWEKLPAVSSNRSFFVARVNGHIWHVVFNYVEQLWKCQIDHVEVGTHKTSLAGKQYFQRIFDAL